MARTSSTMLELGTHAPDFSLVGCDGVKKSRDDFKGNEGLLVLFICNHCPYVIHINDELSKFAEQCQAKGLAVVGINSNDVENYPDDSPEKMIEVAERNNFTFPYLYDEAQDVAKSYMAACTPDFFLFNKDFKLVYRGQFDDSRPKNNLPVTGKDLWQAVDAMLSGKAVVADQKPSMGCNIKWKPGNEPDYFG